jgi:RNA exonuclease 4
MSCIDLTWLGLEKDVDFKGWFDVADLFRIPMQANGSIRYRYFSLRHVAKYLLGLDIQEADHDPIIDAQVAMKVFKQFRYLHETPPHRDAVYQTLLKTPRTPSFAERYPILDGVMMRAPKNPMPPAPPPSMK